MGCEWAAAQEVTKNPQVAAAANEGFLFIFGVHRSDFLYHVGNTVQVSFTVEGSPFRFPSLWKATAQVSFTVEGYRSGFLHCGRPPFRFSSLWKATDQVSFTVEWSPFRTITMCHNVVAFDINTLFGTVSIVVGHRSAFYGHRSVYCTYSQATVQLSMATVQHIVHMSRPPFSTNILMAEVRFGPQLVRDHARNGYLAVPTRFGAFPPVVEFPNFLGVAFVDVLHPEAEDKSEEAVEKLSCQVHHVDHGKKNRGKRAQRKQRQAEEDEKIISHQARLSNSGKSILVGKVRINLNNGRSRIEPEQVIPAVAVENTFQALTGKKAMNNTFKGKLPPKPIKFKQVWRPKKVQQPRSKEIVLEEEAPKEVADERIPTYYRPPRGFRAMIHQGGACAYVRFHDKRAELRRLAHLPLIRENSPASMASTTHDRPGATRVVHDHILHLTNSSLRRTRMLQVMEALHDEAESSSDENDVPYGHIHEQTGRAKPRVSVFERMSFHPQISRRVERDQSESLKIFACHMAGVWSRYGTLPIENEEIIELAERPGAVTRRRAAAVALAATYKAPNTPTTQMTAVSANVITTQGSGGNNEFPPPPPEDPEHQMENQMPPPLPPMAIINTLSNEPAHFYPQEVDPATVNRLMVEQMIEMKLAERGDGEHIAFDVYRVPYPAHHTAKRLPPGITKPPKFDKFNGQGSPKEHIAYYINVMADLASDESYLLKFFGSSLTGLAFEWYSSLSAGSISDWADMQKKFRERFYTTEREVTVAELYATRQRNDESALDYIKRWRNLSMRCKHPPYQEDAV
ncbi:hypothetical protein Taro_009081 [Colocasia esculenta]|uniref:Retrotransposon gag domain-containing protein n=1 Tax=Colocasia esculenta TaxID=4460 RepID=A0A843U5F5_COLES|nr:hypothetical protein [Colocasia esculenta]